MNDTNTRLSNASIANFRCSDHSNINNCCYNISMVILMMTYDHANYDDDDYDNDDDYGDDDADNADDDDDDDVDDDDDDNDDDDDYDNDDDDNKDNCFVLIMPSK